MKKKILLVLALIACIGNVFALDDEKPPLRSGGWEWNKGASLNGKTFYSVAESYNEQDGWAYIEGSGKLHYWLYDTYSYHKGDGSDIIEKYIPDWVKSLGFSIDTANKKHYSPNNNLAFSVKALMQERNCDMSVSFVDEDPCYPFIVINNYDKDKKIYFTDVLPLIVKGKQLYRGGVYGQSFELWEYSADNAVFFMMFMCDNKSKSITTFDKNKNYATVFVIYSKWYTNKSEYNKAVESAKTFFESGTNYVALSDIPKCCALEPSCRLKEYNMRTLNSGTECIYLEWKCSDIHSLINTFSVYNKNGDYAILRQNAGKRKE